MAWPKQGEVGDAQGVPETESSREEFALWAYRMAQAMVRAEQSLHTDEG